MPQYRVTYVAKIPLEFGYDVEADDAEEAVAQAKAKVAEEDFSEGIEVDAYMGKPWVGFGSVGELVIEEILTELR